MARGVCGEPDVASGHAACGAQVAVCRVCGVGALPWPALFRPGVHAGGMPRVCRPGMGRPRGRCCVWPGARFRLLVMRIACAGAARLSALPMPADAGRRAVCR